ncbi:MAG: hemerythrin family protein [Candidatus Omnitrophica bacterium]|nr:hemerythrin family protein [Candidatus Omnitrophota bacterium]
MVLYKLDESTTTGIPVIDGQHKELFDRVNNLLMALTLAKGNEEVGNTVNFLESYIKVHLSTEEDFMIKNSYPGYPPHKAAHAVFTNNVLKLKKEFQERGATSNLAVAAKDLVGDWFMNHIRTVDMQYVPFLKDKIK